MVKSKKLTKGRSVTIPKDIAAEVGIFGGAAVDLVSVDDMIMIRRHIPVCGFCGKEVPEENHKLCGRTVCAECAKRMREEYDEHYGKDN